MPDQSRHLLALSLRAIGHGSSLWPSKRAKFSGLIKLSFCSLLNRISENIFLDVHL